MESVAVSCAAEVRDGGRFQSLVLWTFLIEDAHAYTRVRADRVDGAGRPPSLPPSLPQLAVPRGLFPGGWERGHSLLDISPGLCLIRWYVTVVVREVGTGAPSPACLLGPVNPASCRYPHFTDSKTEGPEK